MQKYQKIIEELQTSENPSLYDLLLTQITTAHQHIYNRQISNQKYSFQNFLIQGMKQSKSKWFFFVEKLLVILYEKNSPLIRFFYMILPQLITKYVKNNEIKYQNIQECLLLLYNHQYKRYNLKNQQRVLFTKDKTISELYQSQLHKQMSFFKHSPLQPITNLNNLTKNNVKNVLFFLIYDEVMNYDEDRLLSFYRALFIYCGADEKEVVREYSLYLLEKKNIISIFKYAISEEELQWIILTLYELCIKVKKHKFQLLAVINIVHKKTSNQCQFRMSQISQSLIHLLEDQYSQVFG